MKLPVIITEPKESSELQVASKTQWEQEATVHAAVSPKVNVVVNLMTLRDAASES